MKRKINCFAFTSIPIFIFIISLFFGLPLFDTNDDLIILNILSGRLTGSPHPCTSFFSVFLGYIISSLYKIAYLPWYPAFVIISIILGQMCIFNCIYKTMRNKNINLFFSIILILLYIPFALHTILRPTYTISSVLLGVASIYFLNKKKLPLSLVLLMLSTMVRYESGFVACAFWGINYIYLHFSKTKKISLKFVTVGILALVLVLGSYIGDETIKSHIEPKGFNSFMKAMQLNFDYPKTAEFEQNRQEIFKEAGIDETLYVLNHNCHFLMDDRINVNSFGYLNKYAFSLNNRDIKGTLSYLIGIWRWNPASFFITFLFVFVAIYALMLSFRKDTLLFLSIFLSLLFSLLLNTYLAIRARILMRALYSYAFPSLIISFLSLGNAKKPLSKKTNIIFALATMGMLFVYYIRHIKELGYAINIIPILVKLKRIVFAYPIVFILIVLVALAIIFARKKAFMSIMIAFVFMTLLYTCKNSISIVQANNRLPLFMVRELQDNREKIENYAYHNKDNIYIHGVKFDIDCRIILPKYDISNLIHWGGTYAHSSAHVLQMKKAGLEKFDISELVKPNVYFVEHEYNTWLMDQIKHLLSTKGIESTYSFADYIDKDSKIGVFKFNKN